MEAEFGIEVGIIWIWRCRKQSGRPEHKNNICFPIFYVPLEMLIVSCGRQTSPSPRGSLPSARICFWFVTPAVHSLVCFNKKSICCFFQRIKEVVKFFFFCWCLSTPRISASLSKWCWQSAWTSVITRQSEMFSCRIASTQCRG